MITTTTRQPTNERLLDAGVALFAEKGFRETTVGDIEAAVGLQPRRGAMYRHFESKEALLRAALERHLKTVAEAGGDLVMTGVVLDDARTFGAWLLGELDRERPIVRILEQEGTRLPELREAFRRELVDAGYLVASAFARQWLGHAAKLLDVDAFVVVIMGGLINFRRSTWTFGSAPLDMGEDRFLARWAQLCAAAVSSSDTTTTA